MQINVEKHIEEKQSNYKEVDEIVVWHYSAILSFRARPSELLVVCTWNSLNLTATPHQLQMN